MNSYIWIHMFMNSYMNSESLHLNLYTHEFIYSWIHKFISYMNSYKLWIHMIFFWGVPRFQMLALQHYHCQAALAKMAASVAGCQSLWAWAGPPGQLEHQPKVPSFAWATVPSQLGSFSRLGSELRPSWHDMPAQFTSWPLQCSPQISTILPGQSKSLLSPPLCCLKPVLSCVEVENFTNTDFFISCY